jgi:hypothetical protein
VEAIPVTGKVKVLPGMGGLWGSTGLDGADGAPAPAELKADTVNV